MISISPTLIRDPFQSVQYICLKNCPHIVQKLLWNSTVHDNTFFAREILKKWLIQWNLKCMLDIIAIPSYMDILAVYSLIWTMKNLTYMQLTVKTRPGKHLDILRPSVWHSGLHCCNVWSSWCVWLLLSLACTCCKNRVLSPSNGTRKV